MRKLLAALLLVVCAPGVSAQPFTGTKLQEWIAAYERLDQGRASQEDAMDAAMLVGFVTGVEEGIMMSGLICAPLSSTPRQFVAIVSKYMRANPEKWSLWASVLVAAAIVEAFPCRK